MSLKVCPESWVGSSKAHKKVPEEFRQTNLLNHDKLAKLLYVSMTEITWNSPKANKIKALVTTCLSKISFIIKLGLSSIFLPTNDSKSDLDESDLS